MFIFIMCTKTALGLSRETLLTFTGAINLLLKYDNLIYIHYMIQIYYRNKIKYTCIHVQTAVYIKFMYVIIISYYRTR